MLDEDGDEKISKEDLENEQMNSKLTKVLKPLFVGDGEEG